MTRGTTITLAVLAGIAGLFQALSSAPVSSAATSAAKVPRALAAAGFTETGIRPLTRGGSHTIGIFNAADTPCPIYGVMLDAPDEILPLVRRKVGAEIWSTRRLWLDGAIRSVPETAFGIKALVLRSRLLGPRAADPAQLLLTHPGCDRLIDDLTNPPRKGIRNEED